MSPSGFDTICRATGIVGISPRGFTPTTTIPVGGSAALPDLLGRRFDQGVLNRVWIADFT